MQAILALEDGSLFYGRAVGFYGETRGEVIFNTGMTGYEGVLSDPSYCGQIVVMTYPLIGNYGLQARALRARPYIRGLVVREACDRPGNRLSRGTLGDFLRRRGVVGVAGVDTRAITRRLRKEGAMRGVIATGNVDGRLLFLRAREAPRLGDEDFLPEVTVRKITTYPNPGPRVAVLDLGGRASIIRSLTARECEVVVFPADTTADTIARYRPDGIMATGGPGDPLRADYVVRTLKHFIGRRPLFGVGLGYQLLGLALGARTFKMRFGHRGGNYPVRESATGRISITAHNHGFAVDEDSLQEAGLVVTHRNLNDGTAEGFRHAALPVGGVQFHPEALFGPRDAGYLFDDFIAGLKQEER